MRASAAFTTAILTASALVVPAAADRTAQRATVERHVFVRVTDARSQPVAGLTPADFTVREDDVAREVLRVSPMSPPSHVALLVDNTDEVSTLLVDLRASLTAFAFGMTALPTPPAVSVTTYAERPTVIVPFTSSDAALERGIQRLFQRPGSGAYFFDAIIEACQALRKQEAARPVIVAFVMDASAAFSDQTHTRVADALRDARASLWTVHLQANRPANTQNELERARVVNDVTGWSGGMTFPILSGEGVKNAFATISAAILGRYDVTYARPDALIPPTRLSVESRDPALRLSAARWAAP